MGRKHKKKKTNTGNSNANEGESSKQTNNSTPKPISNSKIYQPLNEQSNSETKSIGRSTSRENELLNNEVTVSKSKKLNLDKSYNRDDQVEEITSDKQFICIARSKTREEDKLRNSESTNKRGDERQESICNRPGTSSNYFTEQKHSRHTGQKFKQAEDERTEFDKFETQFIKNKNATFMDFKVVQETFGDLFTAGDDCSLGHCVAEDMCMGSGIAVTFRRDFKRVDELLNQRKTQGEVAVLQDKQRYIYYLVTKRISSGKPTYHTLWSSLHAMRKHIISYDVKKLSLPRIGCGLDGLEWDCVKKMLEYIFHDVDIGIVIYNFQQAEFGAPPPASLRKCRVVNEDYTISKIASGTMIVYFGSEDNQPTDQLKMMNQAFPSVIRHYQREKKEAGKFVFFDKNNDGNAFYGCIVRKKCTDPIDFIYFQKCLNQIQSRNRKDGYGYIAFEAFVEDGGDRGMTVSKLVNLMRYSFAYVEVYVCWPENLIHLKPRV